MKIQEEVKKVVKQAIAKHGKIKQILWVGAGGSFGGFYVANYFLQQEAKTFLPQCIPVVNLFM
ncbi:hypothetical protein [Lactobacillus bombicola]|uniref:hypothetical protein n=1 Tax=Lactobacillus bombicola TaxID=1505723 RepID=UPI0021751DB9|nr:hypothetical protein [Lactobacillus bombicola]